MHDLPLPLSLPRLHGVGVVLRAFRDDDLELIEEVSSDPLIPLVTTVPSDYSREAGLAFIERQHDRARSGAGYSLAIAVRPEERAIGQIGLWIAELAKGRAELGYWVAASGRRQGIASEALALLSAWALANLPIKRLTLYIEPWNTGSVKVAERAGFHSEGLLQRWELIDGVPRDMLAFARFPPGVALP